MPLATKNNAIIVKDGLLAESCGCCGGWYCCADTTCSLNDLATASISITASDYYCRFGDFSGGTDGALYESIGVRLASYDGVHSLLRTPNPGPSTVRFEKGINLFGARKCDGLIYVEVSRLYLNWSISFTAVQYLAAYGQPESLRYRSLSELDCSDFTQFPGGLLIEQKTIPSSFNGVDANKACDPITGVAFTPATRRFVLGEFSPSGRPSNFFETGSRELTVNSITLNS